MDIQDHLLYSTSKFFHGENICVDIVKETIPINNSDVHNDTHGQNITAHSLRSLLSRQISSKAFYFISGQKKSAPNGILSNGDVSYTRETFDFNSTCNTNRSNSTGSEDHSIFGSPLKLQTFANVSVKTSSTLSPATDVLKKQNDFVQPIPLKDARKILQKFNQTNIQGSCMNMAVAFCDGHDCNKTILLGEQIECTDSGKELRMFAVTADKVTFSELEQPSEKTEQGYHLTARYRIMDKIDGLGSLVLEARWSDPLGRMKLTKLQSTEFLLHVDVASGCDQSPVFNYYCQLQKVQVLLEGFKTGELPEVLSQKTQQAVIQLKDLFTRIKQGEAAAANLFRSEDSKGTSIAGMLCGTARQLNLDSSVDGDFTDMLWQIITNCTDVSDLVQCLNTTFCALRKGDLKVFVHKANQTTIAKLVRQSYCRMASFPSLNGNLPLLLATEIGMEKIRKDYYAMFVNNGLCTSWQWESFFQELTPAQEETMDMEEFNVQSLEIQFDILSKLHHCLEIVSVMDSFTENQDLKSIAKHITNHYKSVNSTIPHSFTIPITALQASHEIKKHSLFSIKRESTGTGDCNVVSLMSELPDEIALPSLTASSENGNISSFGDLREFYMFRYQEHTVNIDYM